MFRYYKQEQSIFAFEDYGALLELARGKKKALEFGPGMSTWALLEAGCKVDSCEYQLGWALKARRMFPGQPVRIHNFSNVAKIEIPALVDRKYDIAFVDSPIAGKKWEQIPGQEGLARWNSLWFALERSPLVVLHDALRPGEQKSLEALKNYGYRVEVLETKKGLAVIYV